MAKNCLDEGEHPREEIRRFGNEVIKRLWAQKGHKRVEFIWMTYSRLWGSWKVTNDWQKKHLAWLRERYQFAL
jgi:hypothetical protein